MELYIYTCNFFKVALNSACFITIIYFSFLYENNHVTY